jgi:ubiquinol-cytochrome c reductase cytochrome b subunit
VRRGATLNKVHKPYSTATLNRFFSLHFFLPFVIAGLTVIHLALLHKDGSNNPLGVDSGVDKVPFYPYFFVKDLFAFFILLFIFGALVYYSYSSTYCS